jgi:hypothetical protein
VKQTHIYAVRPRKDHRGVDLISDALRFGRLWYGEPDAISNAIGYASFVAAHTILVFDSAAIMGDGHGRRLLRAVV